MRKIGTTVCIMLCVIIGFLHMMSYVHADTYRNDSIHSKTLDAISLQDVDRVMIVAHPDDEVIWGGNHLLTHQYFVICLSNGSNDKRAKEFHEAMKKAKTPHLILNYPDKIKGVRNDWKLSQKAIKKDIQTILQYKPWTMVITHNPQGEYGHIHHKKLSNIVTEEIKRNQQEKRLFYFGKYYKKRKMKDIQDTPKLNQMQMKAKNAIFQPYTSQMKVKQNLYHMFPYENWIPYNQWKK